MCKKPLLTIVFIMALFKGYSQDNKLVLGVDAGAGFSMENFTDSAGTSFDYDNGLALFMGLNAEYRINEMFSIRSGLYYESKKSKYSSSISFFGFTFNVEGQTQFTYLTIPVAANFSYGEDLRFFAGAGPNFSFLLAQKSKVTTSGTVNNSTESEDKDEFKPLDLGLTFNAGVGIPIGDAMELSFTLRDNLGLSNMFKEENRNGKMKYNCLYLTVGFGLKL